MNNDPLTQQGQTSRSSTDEAGVDTRGYLAAIGRSRGLIILTVLICTGVVLAISLALPASYQSIARISLDDQTGVFGTQDAESTRRNLATLETLITSREVLAPAAAKVPGEDFDSMEASVTSSVDENANIINVVGEDGDPDKAAAIAQAVATSFLEVQAKQERQRLQRAEQDLRSQIDVLSASTDPASAAQVRAIQDQLSQITVQIELAGTELQIAQPAEVPSVPASPRPVRNTVLALFGSLFIGILIALARDQFRPRVRSVRQFSRLAGGVPVLATVPIIQRGPLRRSSGAIAAEHEAYQTLRAAVLGACPPSDHAVILVSSALHGEGKTTVTARLGRALAQAGHRTLLISADLRVPSLNKVFDLPLSPGLSETIDLVKRAKVSDKLLPAAVHNVGPSDEGGRPAYPLEVVTSGAEPDDPAEVLGSEAASRLFKHIRGFRYDYVLVDCPPLLGIADVQALIPHADQMLLVGRMDRLTPEGVIETSELLGRLDVRPMGLVVIGASSDSSPYHYMQRYSRSPRGETSARS